MKKILSVFMALCTVLTTLCIPPAPAVAQSTEPLASAQIEKAITLPVEEAVAYIRRRLDTAAEQRPIVDRV